jgi:hypothetical protein
MGNILCGCTDTWPFSKLSGSKGYGDLERADASERTRLLSGTMAQISDTGHPAPYDHAGMAFTPGFDRDYSQRVVTKTAEALIDIFGVYRPTKFHQDVQPDYQKILLGLKPEKYIARGQVLDEVTENDALLLAAMRSTIEVDRDEIRVLDTTILAPFKRLPDP